MNMKTYRSLMTILIFVVVGCGGAETPTVDKTPDKLIKFRVHNEEIQDAPIKTQVSLDLVIEETGIKEQEVRDLLIFQYTKNIKRTGFKHSVNPTSVYIYAYASQEKAEAGKGQWIGMVSTSISNSGPRVTISEKQLKAISEAKQERWGLSYDQRQEIWNKLIKTEDKAQMEADEKFPLDNPAITVEEMSNNVDLNKKLIKDYKKALASEQNIDIGIIDSINKEGRRNGWVIPN